MTFISFFLFYIHMSRQLQFVPFTELSEEFTVGGLYFFLGKLLKVSRNLTQEMQDI